MAIQLSTLSDMANDANLVGNGAISSTEHNAHRTAVESRLSNFLTALRDAENNFANASAPADKPAGKIWFDSTNLLMKYYSALAGTPQVLAGTDMLGAAAVSTPGAGRAALGALATDGFGVAKSSIYTLNESGTRWEQGGGAAKNIGAIGVDIGATYVDATGESGADNTAQIVGTQGNAQAIIKANSLNAKKRGIGFRILHKASGSSAIVVTVYLGTAGSSADQVLGTWSFGGSQAGGTWIEGEVLYVSSTTVHFMGIMTTPSVNTVSAVLIGGTTNIATGSQMYLSVGQSQVAATHLTIYAVRVWQLG